MFLLKFENILRNLIIKENLIKNESKKKNYSFDLNMVQLI